MEKIHTTVRVALMCSVLCVGQAFAQQAPLDKTLAPADDSGLSNVFKDMGVVQRRAMKKSGKFLISNYGALDFSDGPYSMYAFTLNPGYAISDFFEIYINAVPFFISNKRSIVTDIESLKLDPAQYPDDCAGVTVCTAKVGFVKPKTQLGLELLWAPAYGKDSVGSRRVIRSDTFFKAGVMNIFYEGGQSGLKIHGGIGKTYFLDDWLGFRFAATGNYIQTIRSIGASAGPTKVFKFFAIVEAGVVFYL